MAKGESKGEKKVLSEASRDYTVNLHKRLHKTTFKKKAPKALKEIREFAQKNMLTDVNCCELTLGRQNRHQT